MFDVIVIGAGVIGCSVARELSKYSLNICVLEKGSDVAVGTTKANSAIVHAGHDAKPGYLKAVLNKKGNVMFDRLSKELDFPFKRNGSLVVCFNKDDLYKLQELKERGEQNGISGLKILEKNELMAMEPNLNSNIVAALYAPTGGIVCPYEMTIALAENAFINGVDFKFNCEVLDVVKEKDNFIVKTNLEDIRGRLIVNAAGVNADSINNMVSENKINIIARKGEYCLFDKISGKTVEKTIFQLPTKMGKGVLVTPTVDGNLLIGPNAIDIESKGDLNTTGKGLEEILEKAKFTLKSIPMRSIITSFAGLRAHSTEDDFIIGEAEDVENFINAAGIESPGLSSAPAIAEMIENIVIDKLNPDKNHKFNPIRKGIPKFREMSNEERKEIIKTNPLYGNVICRCELVTEGEIVEAIRRPMGARDLDGVKRRTRAGMGRCQSGFCSTKVVDILARELNMSRMDVTKFGSKSNILLSENKR